MPRVVLEKVSKRFERVTALENISLSFEDGDYSCILGPTGSGKTTLLRIIAGFRFISVRIGIKGFGGVA